MGGSLFELELFRNAWIAGLCAGITCGIVGTFVVAMHLSFLGVCIAHAAFAGSMLGVWLGFDPLVGALVFTVGAALAVGPLSDRGELSPDSAIGILFSLMLGLAFLFVGMMPGSRAAVLSYFWGNILAVTRQDLACLGVTCVVVVALVVLFFKEIHAVICHRDVALAVGIPATAVFYAMLFATGITVAVSLRPIGGLLVYSLLLNPGAAAFQLTYNFRRMVVLAAVFGVASCWLGLGVSFVWDLGAGACIVIASSCIFALALLFSPKRKVKAWKPAV
ncbi:MAG: metal ABC transporter permease [bacterium]|nr:metal ABC transporter permease [bacterium]